MAALSLLGVWGASASSGATLSTSQPCRTVFNEEVPVTLVIPPGDTIEFTMAPGCPGGPGYFFGIRSVGARTGAVPATAGTVESTNDGTTWTTVVGEVTGFGSPSAVRYTAPTNGTKTDSFYLISAACGGGYAGYIYSVTVGFPGVRNQTVWQQSIGRPSADAPCPTGFSGSWAQWPNSGRGGWVCVRDVYAYGSD
jgi:hypothetical protein